MFSAKRVSRTPLLPVRCRSATRTHCRTLPSDPTCGSPLQYPFGKRTCWPATGFSIGAAAAPEEAAATVSATTRPIQFPDPVPTTMSRARVMKFT